MTRPFRISPVVFLIAALALPAAPAAADETDRLARLARVWAAVKYLHPVMLQRDVDWDGALVRAVPAVRAAATDDDLARAIGSMLKELDDRATRVVQVTAPATPAQDVALIQRSGDTVVVNLGPYADAKGPMALFEERAALMREIHQARPVIVDVRHRAANAEAGAVIDFLMSDLGGFSSEPVAAPSMSYVIHSGYRPQQGTTSGGYHSGLLTVAGATFVPMPGAAAPSRVIFVTDGGSMLPELAVALRAAGKALIVSSAPLGDEVVAHTQTVDLGGSWRAVIRVSQISGAGFAADVVAADPLAEALAIAGGKPVDRPAQVATTTSGGSSDVRWRPDPDYRDMRYPDVAHRLLAAFRIWSVIHYFYPYKSLIGDWDAALTDAIPQFIAAANEYDYAMAVLQMVARVEDGHSSATGHPAVARLLGTWGAPLEVRLVENEFVVTRIHEGIPADVDLRVGDVVVSVDGEPLRARVDRLRRFVTASTDEARINRVVAVALRGESKSTLTLTVRGADDLRSVRVPRVQAPRPSMSGEPFRVMDGNVGYVDLTRLNVTDVDRMFDALKATTAIVFDMRGYPRGTAWDIAPRINTRGPGSGPSSGARRSREPARPRNSPRASRSSSRSRDRTSRSIPAGRSCSSTTARSARPSTRACSSRRPVASRSSARRPPARTATSRASFCPAASAWGSRDTTCGMPMAGSCSESASSRTSACRRPSRVCDRAETKCWIARWRT